MTTVRQGTAADRAALEALWDYSFEARTTPFFQFYFTHCFRPKETLVVDTEAGVAAALHLRPRTLIVRGVPLEVTYIVGLATHPAARGRGYARRLLAAALEAGVAQGRYANILMPSSMGLYRPYGWALWCHLWRREARLRDIVAPAVDGVRLAWLDAAADTADLAVVYAATTAQRSGYARRTTEDWRRWLTGQLAEGHVIAAYTEDGPLAYWAYSIADGVMTVGEQATPSPRARAALMRWLSQHSSEAERAVWYAPFDDCAYYGWRDGAEQTYMVNRTLPWMTMRIADVPRWWAQIPAAADGRLVVAVRDPWRTETLRLEVAAQAGACPAVTPATRAADISLGVGALGTLLMGGLDAAVLAREERLTGSADAIACLQRMFPATHGYNMEWY